MRKQRGFSLIELLIVIAIILVIAAIAIPNLLRARMSANEAAAVQNMRTIDTAESAYYLAGWSNPGALGFSTKLSDLGNSGGCNPTTATSACQLDQSVANATTAANSKAGYYFVYTPVNNGTLNNSFTLNAEPTARGSTGQRSFYTDPSGIIRANPSQTATLADNPI